MKSNQNFVGYGHRYYCSINPHKSVFGHFVGLALKRVIGKVGYLRAFAAFAFSETKSKKEKIFT